ncbi:glycosyltransferase family 2 protein [Paenibacillus sp. SAF-054]|uniref:glycosyltransferase family 2 protein n=1 Tax=unclassified Paenibacillus TaxID=185978 RepID=UPI003F81E6D9
MKKTFGRTAAHSAKTRKTRAGRRRRHAGRGGSHPGGTYRLGYERGYEQGLIQGKEAYTEPFHGTSIIIPSYNQADYLARCIESIESHTAEPHEIIVVDNGSTDGTGAYLEKRSGRLRFKRFDTNRGFAGGVNQGLMMARGDSIVILNNDTLVTPGWLSHMLRCLHSDPEIGAVGPVTNYISGEQQIDVPYKSVEEMWNFAASRSMPDEGKWKETDRLVGFCVLFRRTLLERIGYFDEGFRIGNYEDDDWIIRIRLCGLKLMIAGDSFIHHFGSVSMKNLGEKQFREVEGHNGSYYAEKWGNPYAWVAFAGQHSTVGNNVLGSGQSASPADFYPSHVLIRDQGERQFLLYRGHKYPCGPLQELVGVRPVTLSRMDIRSIPTADAIIPGEELLALLQHPADEPKDGQLVCSDDGTVYQWCDGSVRPFVSDFALGRWELKGRSIIRLPADKMKSVPRGLPLIAPPVLLNPVL